MCKCVRACARVRVVVGVRMLKADEDVPKQKSSNPSSSVICSSIKAYKGPDNTSVSCNAANNKGGFTALSPIAIPPNMPVTKFMKKRMKYDTIILYLLRSMT